MSSSIPLEESITGYTAVSQTLDQVSKRRPGFPWAWQAWGVEVEGGFPAPQLEAALPRQEAAMIRSFTESAPESKPSLLTPQEAMKLGTP